jgi:hypothetical protein
MNEKEILNLCNQVNAAYAKITRKKGLEHAPNVHEIQEELDKQNKDA